MSLSWWLENVQNPLVLCLILITFFILYLSRIGVLKYYFKFGLYLCFTILSAFIIITLSIIRPGHKDNSKRALSVSRPLCKSLGLKWVVTGKQHLDNDASAVIVCNHQSVLDMILVAELWPIMKKCAPVSKKSTLYIFPIGPGLWLGGTKFIERNKVGSNALNKTAKELQKQKTKLWIYPEGTRTKSSDLMPFKKGAFHIAVQNNLPIIPVVISPYKFIDDDKKVFNNCEVHVTILPPIETHFNDDVTKLSTDVRELMNQEFHRLTDDAKLHS